MEFGKIVSGASLHGTSYRRSSRTNILSRCVYAEQPAIAAARRVVFGWSWSPKVGEQRERRTCCRPWASQDRPVCELSGLLYIPKTAAHGELVMQAFLTTQYIPAISEAAVVVCSAVNYVGLCRNYAQYAFQTTAVRGMRRRGIDQLSRVPLTQLSSPWYCCVGRPESPTGHSVSCSRNA